MKRRAWKRLVLAPAMALVALVASLATGLGATASAQTIAPAAAEAARAAMPATANDANAAVKELLAAMHYRELMAGVFGQMAQTMPATMRQMSVQAIDANVKLSDEQRAAAKARLDTEIPRMVTMMQTLFSDPALLDEMEGMVAPLYTKYFSAAEIRQIAAFYRSETGAKMLKLMPQIVNDSMRMSQQIVMPRVLKMVQQSMGDAPNSGKTEP